MPTIAPFHEYADEIGTFVFQERAREAELNRQDYQVELPSENYD
ncbi:MAG: hypothetical protein ACLP01_16285 [Solirubrobacteraceae bacterium]